MVRKVVKFGFYVMYGDLIEDFFLVYVENVCDYGILVLFKCYFYVLLEVFFDDCEILIIWIVDYKLVFVILFFYFCD